jgi:hypothetical protein
MFVNASVWRLTIASLLLLPALLESQEYPSQAPRSGDRCFICGAALSQSDVVLTIKGRRVPLKQAMVDSFLQNQDHYFAALQPRAALFQENAQADGRVSQGGISTGWFLFGLYVLAMLLFAGLSGYSALAKGLPAVSNFFLGLLLGPVGYLFVLTRSASSNAMVIPRGLAKIPATHEPVVCPACSATNHPAARQCLDCGGELTPKYQPEVGRLKS